MVRDNWILLCLYVSKFWLLLRNGHNWFIVTGMSVTWASFLFFFWVHLMLLMSLGSSLLIPLESFLGTLHMSLSFSFCWYWLQLIALLMPTPCQKKQNIVILIWLNSFFRSNVSRFWKVYYSFCICRWLLSMLLGFSTIAYLLYVLTWLTFALTLIVVLYLGCFCWPVKRGHYRMLVQCLS